MQPYNDFWNQLQTYETFKKRSEEELSQIDFLIEKAKSCLKKCQQNVQELNSHFQAIKIPPTEETVRLQDAICSAMTCNDTS